MIHLLRMIVLSLCIINAVQVTSLRGEEPAGGEGVSTQDQYLADISSSFSDQLVQGEQHATTEDTTMSGAARRLYTRINKKKALVGVGAAALVVALGTLIARGMTGA